MIHIEKIVAENAFMITDRTEIKLKDGMCLVDGKNGAGKSTINKLIKLCLTGKSDGAWHNRFKKGKHRVSLYLRDEINAYEIHIFKNYRKFIGKDMYLEELRSRTEDIIYIKNGINLSRSADKKGTIKIFQDDINFNENVFNYVNMMGGNEPYLPSLTDSVLKKKFDDIIYVFKDINDYKQRAAEKYSEYQDKYNDFSIKENELNVMIEMKTKSHNETASKIETEKIRLQKLYKENEREKDKCLSEIRILKDKKSKLEKEVSEYKDVSVINPSKEEQELSLEIPKIEGNYNLKSNTKLSIKENIKELEKDVNGFTKEDIRNDYNKYKNLIDVTEFNIKEFKTLEFIDESDKEKEINNKINEIQTKLSVNTFTIKGHEGEGTKLEKETKNPICPTCKQKISVKKQKDRIAFLKDKIKELKSEKKNFHKDLKNLKSELEKIINDRNKHNSKVKESYVELENLRNDLFTYKNKLEEINKIIEKFNKLKKEKEEIKELDKEIAELSDILKNKKKEYDKLVKERENKNADAYTIIDKRESLLKSIYELDSDINNMQSTINNLREVDQTFLNSLRNDLKNIENELSKIHKDKNKIVSRISKLNNVLVHIKWVKDVLFSNKGLKTSILQNAAKEMTIVANNLYKKYFGNNIEIQISTHKQLKKKDPDTGLPMLKEKFSITATNKNGADCFNGLSTGEQQMVNQCCIEAFGKLSRKFGKLSLGFMYGDESFNGLKGINVDNMIKYLRDKPLKTKLITSHNDDVKEYFDNILLVTKDITHGSKYKYV